MTEQERPRIAGFPSREARAATEFLADVAKIVALPEAIRADLVAAYLVNIGERIPEDDDAFDSAIDRLREAGLRWLDVYQAFRALQWFVQELVEHDDDEPLVEMLDGRRSKGTLDDVRVQAIEALISAIRGGRTATEMKIRAARTAASVGVLPSFAAVHATQELRGVFVETDRTDRSELVGFEPIASLRIDLDSGDPSSFAFQATLEDVNELLGKLEQVAEKLDFLRARASRLEVGPNIPHAIDEGD